MSEHTEKLARRLSEIKGKYYVIGGTGASNKADGLRQTYSRFQMDALTLNPESYGFSEPISDVLRTTSSKAKAVAIITGKSGKGEYKEVKELQFDVSNLDEINPVFTNGEEFIIDVMDAETVCVQGTSHKTEPEGDDEKINFLKLSRQLNGDETEQEKQAILDQDKEKVKNLYSKPFTTFFRIARGIFSSDKSIANMVGIECRVEFDAIPPEIIDEAYLNPDVWKIGPRVNLADLTRKYPNLIRKIWVRDIDDSEDQFRKVKKEHFRYVGDLVIHGSLPDRVIEKLLGETDSSTVETKPYQRIRAVE